MIGGDRPRNLSLRKRCTHHLQHGASQCQGAFKTVLGNPHHEQSAKFCNKSEDNFRPFRRSSICRKKQPKYIYKKRDVREQVITEKRQRFSEIKVTSVQVVLFFFICVTYM